MTIQPVSDYQLNFMPAMYTCIVIIKDADAASAFKETPMIYSLWLDLLATKIKALGKPPLGKFARLTNA